MTTDQPPKLTMRSTNNVVYSLSTATNAVFVPPERLHLGILLEQFIFGYTFLRRKLNCGKELIIL